MDKFSEAKSLHKELMNEYSETISKMNKEQQERLWNILTEDSLTIEQKKQLFLESINTSECYKLSQMLNLHTEKKMKKNMSMMKKLKTQKKMPKKKHHSQILLV